MKQCVFTIHVLCTDNLSVEGKGGGANMVLFGGYADTPDFKGEILAGGCDTQKRTGDTATLSARYMLRGTDAAGKPCSIFIENNGCMKLPPAGPVIETIPLVRTDSPLLQWLEDAALSGRVSPEGENGVLVEIFAEVNEA